MGDTFYKHWAVMCLPLSLLSSVIILSCAQQIGWLNVLIWFQFVVYLLHQFEEHAYPGGFKDFVNREIFQSTRANFPLNDKNIFWINIPFIWVAFPVCALLAQNVDSRFGMLLPYFGLFNASLHILTTIIKRQYNPGLGVSVVLNYPTGLYTIWQLGQQTELTLAMHISAFVIALLGHLIIVAYARSVLTSGSHP